MNWTPEQTELLKRLRNDGLSATEIAASINRAYRGAGVSRNAVIGKLDRLGIEMSRGARDATARASNLKRPKAPEWPASHIAALRRHHEQGLSARESERALSAEFPGAHYTRDAVCTKRARLGLKVHPVAASINNKRLRPPADGPVVQSVTPAKPRIFEIPTTAKVMADLGPRDCRWHVGPDPGLGNGDRQLFCAAVRPEGAAYCPDHALVAYQKQRSPAEKAADEKRAATMRAGKGKAPNINSRLFAGGKGRAA